MGRVIGILLVPIAAFCVVGFLAAGEPGVSGSWRTGYAIAGGLALVCSALLLRGQREP